MSVTPHETQLHVAAEARAEIARQRLTLREVAARLGMVHTSLHRRLTGEIDFSVSELAALADVLEVPLEQFFEGRKRTGANFVHYLRNLLHVSSGLFCNSTVITAA